MRKPKKLTAAIFLLVHGISIFYPGISYSLTSGPSQPEASQFQAASVTDLVDPFTGDFSYNIPLLDVDGYPVNIAYNSGGGMDDEASWVGFGWNINSGSVSRTMKGIPDDFNGEDKIQKSMNLRPDITGGVAFNVSTEVFGLDFLGANASVDIFYNNQRGLGVEIGAGISASTSSAKHVAGEYTYGLSAGGNLGIRSNSQTGADFNFSVNAGISASEKEKQDKSVGLGIQFGGGLNSRAGLKSTTLGASFNTSIQESKKSLQARRDKANNQKLKARSNGGSTSLGSTTTNYGLAFNPTISMPMHNESYSLSPMAGPEFWGFNAPTFQLSGHYTKQKLSTPNKEFPAYGFLYGNKAKSDPNAVMDFNREKDVPYTESTPTLPVPYVTPDLFTATSHLGSSQFKAFSNSSGIFFDPIAQNTSDAFSLGVEFGIGVGIKGGGDFSYNTNSTVTRKWTLNNDFLFNGDFYKDTKPESEDAYFKLVGERSAINSDYLNRIVGTENVSVKTADVNDQAMAYSKLISNKNSYAVSSKIARNKREIRAEYFSPLSAEKAARFGLDKNILNYPVATMQSSIQCNEGGTFGNPSHIDRTTGFRKAHHFSEINLYKMNGTHLVYGIPVYNKEQTDITFNVGRLPGLNNLVTYTDVENSVNNNAGVDHYFSKELIPAYATSFLITGICTPDYVDITGNGISDDDLGNAVKFNYSLANSNYKWRTPTAKNHTNNYANYSRGTCLAEDDKASISYGTKEIWYQNSIESKNMIAIFRLGDRDDGYGFNPNGSVDLNSKQKRLERIDLYTKGELKTNPSNPIPVKSVVFEYDYSLFPGVANNINNGGKLTLKSIYFTYGKNLGGKKNRYYFTYNPSGNFDYQQYDRWGTYKDKSYNNSIAHINLDNNHFPFSIQDQTTADNSVKKWQLSEIELPSGGKIQVEYESDDYAYVQNKRAMQMVNILGVKGGHIPAIQSDFEDYQTTNDVYLQLPENSTPDKFKEEYFEGLENLYFNVTTDIDNQGHEEQVSGWAKITNLNLVLQGNATSSNIVKVTMESRGGYHPFAGAAWQQLRQTLPKLAYPGYSVAEESGPMQFVTALISSIRNVAELTTPFESKAMRQNFSRKIFKDKCFARIVNKYKKFGGGLRVKRIIMDDVWQTMDNAGMSTRTGMSFEYTREYVNSSGEKVNISSGVASYEPMSGSEENPFKQPITYQQKAHLSSNIYTVEEPLGESYFPAPSVGYSQVTVKNLDAESEVATNGYSIKRFYTSKEFPTKVKRTDLSKHKYNQSSIFGLFKIDEGNSVVLSQGFYVENNDMHGKPLTDETFDGAGKLALGNYYHYKFSGTEQLELRNDALTLQQDGTIKNQVIGEEFEMFHDMREQITDNTGVNLNVNLDVLYLVLIVLPVPTFIPIIQNNYTGYQCASTIKVVNKYAIADKTTVIQDGSSIQTENLLWDPLSGEVLLTKTQNGFDDPIYNFSLPAYMVDSYEQGMGPAYKNSGIIFKNISISNGSIPSQLQPYFTPGDEIGVLDNSETGKLSVLKTNNGLRLIDENGNIFNGTHDLIILRSGRRNMIDTKSYSVVSLSNPIRGGKLDIDENTEIINSSTQTFSDVWTAEGLPKQPCGPHPSINCCPPIDQVINPYRWGLFGSWRLKDNYVYVTNRALKLDPLNSSQRPTNLKKGGSYEKFTSFIYADNVSHTLKKIQPQTTGWDENWISTSTLTRVNSKGQEKEELNALKQYSSVQFGFNGYMPTAVSTNARSNEIGYDGFEDYELSPVSCSNEHLSNCSGNWHFGVATMISNEAMEESPELSRVSGDNWELTTEYSHTGKYSLRLDPGKSIQIPLYPIASLTDQQVYNFNTNNELVLKEGGVDIKFRPLAGKKYIFSAWVKGPVMIEGEDPSADKITIQVASTPIPIYAVRSGPRIEGWTRVTAIFEIPSLLFSNIILTASSSQDAYFDDIRILPYDANMKAFVYDFQNNRLMAQLDENNYATFFEYDDQGQLVRTKKETEKGIITISENRSNIKKNERP